MNEIVKSQLKTTDFEKLDEIVEDIALHLDNRSRPYYNEEEWTRLNSLYTREEIEDALLIYIVENGSPFPFKHISKKVMMDAFIELQKLQPKDVVTFPEYESAGDVEKKVIERYPDNKYGYNVDDYGKGVIECSSKYNAVSDHYFEEPRHKCDTHVSKNVFSRWTTGEGLRTCFGPIWRLKYPRLDNQSFLAGLRLGTYIATQFKPSVAKVIYELFGAKKIIDISCGWGDRLAGFFCSNAEEYYGFDPNEENYEIYKKQCYDYQKILGSEHKLIEGDNYFESIGIKRVRIYNLPAEDANYEELPDNIDCVFSSPPYFCTELYGKGGSKSDAQSWCRYHSNEDWKQRFLFVVLEKCWSRLREGGHLCVNITDAMIKGERHLICDDMMDQIATFDDSVIVGQMGMKIALRPSMMKNEVDNQLRNKVPYVEPIWIARKGGDELNINEMMNDRADIGDLFE